MSRRPPRNPTVQLSKTLSWLLRHGAEKEGFQLLPGGFLYVDSILAHPKYKQYTVEEIQSVVANNDKQRFHIETDDETGRLKIRANQGHTLPVDDLQLEAITSVDRFPVVVHGTYYRFWDSICRQGLKRMKRNHIHFAAGEPGESGVISGMRGSCDLIIHLDLEKALQAGLKFFLSANNVILSKGNEDGAISPDFFKKTVDRKTGKEVERPDGTGGSAALGEASSNAKTLVKAREPLEIDEDEIHEIGHRRRHPRKKKATFELQ